MDKLVECKHCGSAVCYEQNISEELQTWMCMSCGFTTTSLMTRYSKEFNTLLETAPELYKDIMFIDDQNRAWFPATITVPEKGMIFVDGTSKDDWRWAAVPSVPITEEEYKTKKYHRTQKYRMDMQRISYFKKSEFIVAMGTTGFLE